MHIAYKLEQFDYKLENLYSYYQVLSLDWVLTDGQPMSSAGQYDPLLGQPMSSAGQYDPLTGQSMSSAG